VGERNEKTYLIIKKKIITQLSSTRIQKRKEKQSNHSIQKPKIKIKEFRIQINLLLYTYKLTNWLPGYGARVVVVVGFGAFKLGCPGRTG